MHGNYINAPTILGDENEPRDNSFVSRSLLFVS